MTTVETVKKKAAPAAATAGVPVTKGEKKEGKKSVSTATLLKELGATDGFIDPSKVTIIGRDTESGAHFLADNRALNKPDDDMTKEMAEIGVKTSVLLMHIRVNGKDVLAPVDGRQRTINLRAANERRLAKGQEPFRLPFRVVDSTEAAATRDMVVLNEHRIQDDPITRAQKAKLMLDQGQDAASVARAFRVSPKTIKEQWVRVLDMHPEIVAAIQNGSYALNAAFELITLSQEDQLKVFTELKEAGALNMRASEGAVRALKSGGAAEPSDDGEKKKAYTPTSKKDLGIILSWLKDYKKNPTKPSYGAFREFGIGKDGKMTPAAEVVTAILRHLLGESEKINIPGWNKLMERMSQGDEDESEAAAEAPKKSKK